MAEMIRTPRNKKEKKSDVQKKKKEKDMQEGMVAPAEESTDSTPLATVEDRITSQSTPIFEPFPEYHPEEMENINKGSTQEISAQDLQTETSIITNTKEDIETIEKVSSPPSSKELSPFDIMLQRVQKEYEELSDLEKDILEIARETLKKKRFSAEISIDRVENMPPLVEELYSRAVSRLTYTKGIKKEDIFAAIGSLIDKKWIVSGQRRTKQEILESELHRKVLEFISKYPGIHARDELVEKELGVSRNPFLLHVMTLEAFGFIRSVKIGKTIHFFPADTPDIFDDLCALFRNPYVVKIVLGFLNNPNLSLMEIAKRLGVYHGTIQYHIKKLISHNVLIRKDEKGEGGTTISYIVNEGLLKRYNRIFDYPPFFD